MAAVNAARARDYAFADAAATVKQAQKRLNDLEKVAEERADQAHVVTDAAATVEGELRRHAQANADALWKELTANNTKAAERLTAAVRELIDAHTGYGLAGARAAELLRLVAPDQARLQRVPDPPPLVADFARRAGEVVGQVRVPLPSAPGAATVIRDTPREEAGASA